MAIECPKCHFGNTADTKYCGNCGAKLPPSEGVSIPRTKTLEIPKEELTTGSTFAGRYRIIEELGKGGMGKVYKALDTEINEKVAIKLIKPEIASDQKTIERFRSELKFARKIRHKNVCQMFDLNKEEGAYYITMEYVPGEDLKSFIRRAKRLDVGTAVSIAKDVCEGLAEAHRLGVVHRDLKPQNIMVDNDGNARIMDFGIARSLESEGITAEGAMIGTPEYMSPEQVDGMETDPRSDIYSMGVILYEAVTGRVPFKGNTPFSIAVKHKSEIPQEPRKINPQIPEALSRLILKCMEKNKKMRYQKTEDLLSELNEVEQEIPTGERIYPKRVLLLRSIWFQLKERKIITTLAAFIGGGVAIVEFVHHIIINHYHFPKKTLDITATTIICAMICTLTWRWFRGVEKRHRGVKIEFLLIPSVIIIAAIIDLSLFLNIKESEQAAHPEAVMVEETEYKNSIAVLPFEVHGQQEEQEIYYEGLYDDLINHLSRVISGLRVIGKRSAEICAKTDKSIKEIGKELNVEYILTVSLVIDNNKICVNAQLFDAKSEFIIKGYPPYYCDFSNYFEAQQNISHNIASQLKLHYQEEEEHKLKKREPADERARPYYQIGRHFEKNFRDTKEEEFFENCVENYKEAIKIDPNYALAYWGLGNIYESHYIWKEEKEKDLDLMEKNFKKAFEIDSSLAEAYLGMGWVYFYKEDNDEAYDFFKTAIQLEPYNSTVNYQTGSFLYSIGLYQPAIKYYSKSLETDPLHIKCHDLLAQSYSFIGKYDKAANQIKIALRFEPDNSRLHLLHARQLIMMKKFAEAEIELAKVKEIPSLSALQLHRAWLSAAKEERELAIELIKDSQDSYRTEVTSIYSLLGMKDKAIEYLERGIRMALEEKHAEYYSYPFLNSNPYYDNLRDDSRFIEILDKAKQRYEEKMRRYGDL